MDSPPVVKKANRKKPSIKLLRYHENIMKGMSKSQAKNLAGYSHSTQAATIEKSLNAQELTIKDSILQQTTREELAKELLKNARQDDDKGAKNAAIKIAYDRIEPTGTVQNDAETVTIMMKG